MLNKGANMSRIKCQNRPHIVYELTVNGSTYIGVTNVEVDLGVEGSLRRRVNKHWYRLKDVKRKSWALYKAIAELDCREQIGRRVLALCDNKAQGHTKETELIAELKPVLNTDV
jgi:hypothetical protein